MKARKKNRRVTRRVVVPKAKAPKNISVEAKLTSFLRWMYVQIALAAACFLLSLLTHAPLGAILCASGAILLMGAFVADGKALECEVKLRQRDELREAVLKGLAN
ncbi:hypothetical protein COX00_04585 [Candidatus Uhrbacteria bacterium CG22_combo_CG10-13_8_21_14_all_47_17]|uniref:Uncharacterized protein n=1 Tax=Candidatus Uhrbacteria bacterium CG22_combo_CG10-13_8_21_14_all_47_17 TaxID=1975041 RepID=A0A2H0BR60_9BACT|nr:MAG: hypothetical protein COX00_04585 [Candidatus Uhrbacteria bacterium CG22_combo_CG10-13_8_21_14_all_47_17]